jgi:hypothetical protein
LRVAFTWRHQMNVNMCEAAKNYRTLEGAAERVLSKKAPRPCWPPAAVALLDILAHSVPRRDGRFTHSELIHAQEGCRRVDLALTPAVEVEPRHRIGKAFGEPLQCGPVQIEIRKFHVIVATKRFDFWQTDPMLLNVNCAIISR